LGLGAALRQLVSRFSRFHTARVKLALSRMGKVPKKTEVIVYRLVQECMNNVAKHSQATHVNISLEGADGVLRLSVEDDGVGFEVEEALSRRDSYGLAGLRERVALLGGKFYVESHPRMNGKAGGAKSGFDEPGRGEPASKGNEVRDILAPMTKPRGGMKLRGKLRKGTRISIELPLLREANQ
jgi:glucose-6-phosphate-specific signal transduction histidine kinase